MSPGISMSTRSPAEMGSPKQGARVDGVKGFRIGRSEDALEGKKLKISHRRA